jgi:hypothetical protein
MFKRTIPVFLVVFCALLILSPVASAYLKPVFETSFTGEEVPGGPLHYPIGAAADDSNGPSSGDVWVADVNLLEFFGGNPEASTIDKFDASGKYAGVQITPGAKGLPQPFALFSHTFQEGAIAVDSSSGANRGDVYVADIEHGVVDRFNESGGYETQVTGAATLAGSFEPKGVAVSPTTGELYVADQAHHVIDEFSSAGSYLGQIASSQMTEVHSIAVDSSGDVYVSAYYHNESQGNFPAILKFSSSGALLLVLQSVLSTSSLAVDPVNGYLDVGNKPEGQPGRISVYDTVGHLVENLGKEAHLESEYPSTGIAFGPTGKTYVAEFLSIVSSRIDIFGISTVPDVESNPATVAEKSSTLNATVEPDPVYHGGEVTSCQFEYGTSASYGETAPCAPATPYSNATNVSASIGALAPDTEYHFRVSAGDPGEGGAVGGTAYSKDETFITRGPATISAESGLGVTKTANLKAQIDPFGYETSCQVQYVQESEFQSSGYAHASTVPCAQSELSAGFGNQSVSASLSGLSFDSEYHYRFVAVNQAEAGTTYGLDRTFTTFGIESFAFESVDKEGKPYTQAGGHPYQWNIKYALKSNVEGYSDANMKNIVTELPVGFIGNATATPQCTGYANNHSECSGSTQVGVLTIYITSHAIGGKPNAEAREVPVFNVVPPPGVPAQLSANIAGFVNALIDVNVRTGGDYGIISVVHNSTTAQLVKGIWLRLWGVPADKSHEAERSCPVHRVGSFPEYRSPCEDAAQPVPFLVNPSTCTGPLTAKLHIDSWSEPGEYASFVDSTVPGTTGCEHLSFEPKLTVQPEHQIADSPSGLWVELHVPQNVSPEGLSSSTMKKAVVALPPGVSVSPSAADGLVGCSPEEIGLNNDEPPHCPDTSKIGTVEITTPLIYPTLKGEAYIAEQNNNPFDSMIAIYVVAEADGARVKLAGKVELNPVTGQMTTTFDNTPQVPFENFRLYFFGGPRGPLAMPITCGTFSSTSELTPWGAPESGPPADPGDFFSINSGCNVGFAPKFVAGVTDPQAGAYTSFVLSFSREDGEGEPKGLSMSLPPGLLGKVGEVPLCSDADANVGTCPAASQIGTVEAGAGPGSNPLFLPGKMYLTGPYKGGPYGTAVVVPAIAGPYNLGNVVVRQSLRVDPNDAHVQIVSDPFPTIVDGVPLRMRRVDVTLNRPQFMLNPTNCAPTSITGSLSSVTGAVAPVESRFQLTNCGALAFKPHLVPTTSGHTSRANGASLDVTLTYPPNSVGKEANIRSVKVDLPKQLPSRLTTLQKACPDSVFNSNPASCPPLSRIGTATATTPLMPVTLTGPAYFVSHGGAKFPELIVVLSGDNITVYLHGETFISPAGITSSTFRNLPDVPIGVFHLTLPQGPDSALAAIGNLCASKLAMPTSFNAENGLSFKQSTPIAVTGCPKHRKVGKVSGKRHKGKPRKKK